MHSRTGSRTGRPRKLTGSQMARIYRMVVDKDPLQIKFPFALWTRAIVVTAIQQKFGIKLSESSVGRLFRQMGLSCQKPLFRACQQCPQTVAKWKQNVFPAIKKRAKSLGATIYFQDESGIRSDYHSGKTWAPIGQTPIIEATGARFGLNMMGAISMRGELRFMVIKGSVSADQICAFLNRLMHNADRPIFLIWDGHPTHRSKKVRECIDSFNGNLEVYCLPSYSPELNPIEQVWNNVKNHGIGRTKVFGPAQLKAAVLSHLKRIQKLPSPVRAFFQHLECA